MSLPIYEQGQEVVLLGSALLKDGSPAFRAKNAGKPKLYNMKHGTDLSLIEDNEKEVPEKTSDYSKLFQYLRMFQRERNINEEERIIDNHFTIRFTPFTPKI
jgi:hypothetical protein